MTKGKYIRVNWQLILTAAALSVLLPECEGLAANKRWPCESKADDSCLTVTEAAFPIRERLQQTSPNWLSLETLVGLSVFFTIRNLMFFSLLC
jgi:hypothetical protein